MANYRSLTAIMGRELHEARCDQQHIGRLAGWPARSAAEVSPSAIENEAVVADVIALFETRLLGRHQPFLPPQWSDPPRT
jgi:hypothetical protein